MPEPRVLAFSGSTRQSGFNCRLLSNACAIASEAGATVNQVRLEEFPMPIFNQDLEAEQGPPDSVKQLKSLFLEADGLLIASPEYNSSITPLLKNVIDWVSRGSEGVPALAAYRGKTACLVSASPGALGGLRGLRHVREILSNIGVLVTPGQFALNQAHEAFDETGGLKDESRAAALKQCMEAFVATTRKLCN